MHGNSNKSIRKQILYVIIQGRDFILKFGVSAERPGKPGSELDRPQRQVDKFNKRNKRLGLPKVSFAILRTIFGTRSRIKKLEKMANEVYYHQHGEYPPEEDGFKTFPEEDD